MRSYPGSTGYFIFQDQYWYGKMVEVKEIFDGKRIIYMRWADSDPGGSSLPEDGIYLDRRLLGSPPGIFY